MTNDEAANVFHDMRKKKQPKICRSNLGGLKGLGDGMIILFSTCAEQ